jgi:hypothetical protein
LFLSRNFNFLTIFVKKQAVPAWMLAFLWIFAPWRAWAANAEPLPLAVAINGNVVSEGTTVLRENDGTYAVRL